MNIADWLRSLGLGQYEAAFRDNAIDEALLPNLTAEDLKDLGVVIVGHRRRLLDAIAGLRDHQNTTPQVLAPTPTSERAVGDNAERRQVTVVFCDLVGSTALSTRLDPEDLREVISAYHTCVAQVVRRFDGFVAQYLGDGVLIYFGYPEAHEDDAERAVRAGLQLFPSVAALKARVSLQTRVGIATGLVVVGDLIGTERGIVGETPNLAARLQGLAEPNTVMIAAGTRRLLGDLFEYRDVGLVEVKGIAVRVPVWQVLRPSAIPSRFEALRGSALGPLLGRDEELGVLLRRWERAKTGNGQVVLISGEPGLGKSRITTALSEQLRAEPHTRLRYFCSPYHQDSALFPFIDQLSRAAGFAAEDSSPIRFDKLEAILAVAEPSGEDVALLADLLSLPGSDRYPLPALGSQLKKRQTLEAFVHQLEGLARQQPVIIVFEDAHWADPTSRELLDLVVGRVADLRALVVITFRPEFQQSWVGQPQVAMLALNRLARDDRTALVEYIAGGKALPLEVTRQIVERADGVPLFIEEVTKSVLESGLLREATDHYVLEGALPSLAIPATLHDSLMARLDRLASARQVAQIGAAIGREFSYTLLRTVARLPEEELQAALTGLTASELVFQRGAPPDAVYLFKHALVQDAAYGSLLRRTRQQLHARIAEALETDFSELKELHLELLAQHYAEAGLAEPSVVYWEKAGRSSAARSAMAEAAAQFQKGLGQLALLPDTTHRRRQELEFSTALANVLNVHKGFAAPETGQAYVRAQQLWEGLDAPSGFPTIPYGLSRHHMFRAEFDAAFYVDQEWLRRSRQHNESAGLVLGHYSFGRNLLITGRFAEARAHLEQSIAFYDPISHGSLIDQTGTHPILSMRGYMGILQFCLGFPDTAQAEGSAAVADALDLAHPPTVGATLAVDSIRLMLVGDVGPVAERADQLMALAIEQGFPYWIAHGSIFSGWAKVKNGQSINGISLLLRGLKEYRATGAGVFIPHYMSLLAEAYESAGRIEEAASAVDDALQTVEKTGERCMLAELNRQKGQLMLRQGQTDLAETLYRQAMDIARGQEAKMWELRAAVGLARLHRDQGRCGAAREVLAPVYDWFTEGFDTTDVKSAKALCDEL